MILAQDIDVRDILSTKLIENAINVSVSKDRTEIIVRLDDGEITYKLRQSTFSVMLDATYTDLSVVDEPKTTLLYNVEVSRSNVDNEVRELALDLWDAAENRVFAVRDAHDEALMLRANEDIAKIINS